jgi:hypothetical protein
MLRNVSAPSSLRKLSLGLGRRSRGAVVAVAVILVAGLLNVLGVAGQGVAVGAVGTALLPAAGQFTPVAPVKVMDTRNGTGGVPVAPLGSGATVSFPVTGLGQVPSTGVTDVYVVINAVSPQDNGCLQDYDADLADPSICTVSFEAGQNVTDSDIVQVSSAGDVR